MTPESLQFVHHGTTNVVVHGQRYSIQNLRMAFAPIPTILARCMKPLLHRLTMVDHMAHHTQVVQMLHLILAALLLDVSELANYMGISYYMLAKTKATTRKLRREH